MERLFGLVVILMLFALWWTGILLASERSAERMVYRDAVPAPLASADCAIRGGAFSAPVCSF